MPASPAQPLAETIAFVRQYTRPWIDSGQEHGYEDPYTIHQIGELEVRVHASDALLERAGRFVDAAVASPTQENVSQASIAVAEAKAMATEVSVLTTNKLLSWPAPVPRWRSTTWTGTGATPVLTLCMTRCAGNITPLGTIG